MYKFNHYFVKAVWCANEEKFGQINIQDLMDKVHLKCSAQERLEPPKAPDMQYMLNILNP